MKVFIPTLLCGCIAACVSFSASAAVKTYVVPAGTADNTPEAPYDTWAKGANDPRAAADATDAEGTIYILGGSYPDAMQIAPENNVHVKIMATQDETGAFGEMEMGRKLAGYSTALSSTDDKRRFQVDGGTIKLIPTSTDVFTEYATGGWGGVTAYGWCWQGFRRNWIRPRLAPHISAIVPRTTRLSSRTVRRL